MRIVSICIVSSILSMPPTSALNAESCLARNNQLTSASEVNTNIKNYPTLEEQIKIMPRNLDPISGLGQIASFNARSKVGENETAESLSEGAVADCELPSPSR